MLALAAAAALLPLAPGASPPAGAAPAASGIVTVPGLSGPATIARTTDGIAHISALTRPDAWFAQGWVHAQDRLFQMDYLRRVPSGTLAAGTPGTAGRSGPMTRIWACPRRPSSIRCNCAPAG